MIIDKIKKVFCKKNDAHKLNNKEKVNYEFIYLLEQFFNENEDLLYPSVALKEYNLRKSGKIYTLNEHCEALILAKLSNRQKWQRIENNIDEIRNIFFDYDCQKILNCEPEYFIEKIKSIKCGSQVTVRDFSNLHQNLEILLKLEKEFGSIDNFLLSKPAYEIVKQFSDSKSTLKMKTIGPALAWEYLRNVGIDGAKPDIHLKRILSASRLHLSSNDEISDEEFYKIMSDIHKATNRLYIELDNYLWSYCAYGQAEICTAEPKCGQCVIRKYCNRYW